MSPLKIKVEKNTQMKVRRALGLLQVEFSFAVFCMSLQVIASDYTFLQLFAVYCIFLNNAYAKIYVIIRAKKKQHNLFIPNITHDYFRLPFCTLHYLRLLYLLTLFLKTMQQYYCKYSFVSFSGDILLHPSESCKAN